MLSSELQKKIQKIYIRSRHLANDAFSGEYESAFRGQGMEFEEVREYTPGDDVRSIDWNVSARMDKPFVKVFREEREQTIMLMVDASASQEFGSKSTLKKEMVAEVAAVLAYAAVKSNDKVGLLIFSDRVEKYIPPKKGRGHVWHVISEILSFKPKGKKTNMNEAVTYLNRILPHKSVCFMISDFLTKDYESNLSVASFRHDMIALMIDDPFEMELPTGGLMSFQDLETGQYRQLDLSQPKIRRFFEAKRKREIQERIYKFRSIKIDALNLRTDQDYIDPLLKFFRLREKRQAH